MKEILDYDKFPVSFVHCFNEKCARKAECLRYSVASNVPASRKVVTCINPVSIVPPTGENCEMFVLDKPEMFAKGFNTMLNSMPYAEALAAKRIMKHYLGLSTYYRCLKKERLISPNEQNSIISLLKKSGIKSEIRFDEYVEYYDLR